MQCLDRFRSPVISFFSGDSGYHFGLDLELATSWEIHTLSTCTTSQGCGGLRILIVWRECSPSGCELSRETRHLNQLSIRYRQIKLFPILPLLGMILLAYEWNHELSHTSISSVGVEFHIISADIDI